MPEDPNELQVQVRPGHAFDYSDPEEAEQYLERAVRAARDRSVGSEELSRAIRDWTSFYHLSPRRADLLRPIEYLIRGDVLEVGGGCGAVTRYLGETARAVTAIEGSMRRARIMAARCYGLRNVSVHCDNFEDFPFEDRKFDAVLCIGVIEYANKFFRAEKGFDRMLARMGGLLAENGVLVVAIENRLGLKYFAGAPEDHTNRPYDGIQDFYDPKSVLTLGREEWLQRLHRHGLESALWLYPWPDYKTPELIVSDAALRDPVFDPAPWICRHAHGRQDEPGAHLFSEALTWQVLTGNRLAQDLANSFVIVAKRAGSAVHPKVYGLLWEFETERTRALASLTQVDRSGAGDLSIARSAIYEPKASGSREKIAAGERIFDQDLFTILNRPGWSIAQIAAWAEPWVRFLRQTPAVTLAHSSPRHLTIDENGAIKLFDPEVSATESIPLDFAILRGLWNTLFSVRSCAEPAPNTPVNLVDLVPVCLAVLGVDASASLVEDCLAREVALRSAITGLAADRVQRTLEGEKLVIRRRAGASQKRGSFTAQLFWRAASSGFSEAASRFAKGTLESGKQTLSLALPETSEPPVELRFDLTDRTGIARLLGLQVSGPEGTAWAWDGSAASLQSAARWDVSFATHRGAVVMKLFTNDPHVVLPVPPQVLATLRPGATLEMTMEWMDPMDYLRETESA